ncbi:MAG: efflux RND transporter permease subunit [Gammaproteobacteria bacterium]
MNDEATRSDKHDQAEALATEELGLAGRMTRFFIDSPLSPLLFLAMLALGLLGLAVTPRQEDPQISVPMIDIFVQFPGASARQVAGLAIDPLQRIMTEIPGVKHVYAASQRGRGIVTVEFDVGQELGPSIVKVHDKIQSNLDKIPPGIPLPLVKPKGIDDVPIVTLTLWSKDVDDGRLRTLALDVLQSLKEIPNTGFNFIVGGRKEQVRVEVYPERLSGFGVSFDQVAETIRTANSEQQVGNVEAGDTHFTVVTGAFLRTADDISRLVVGSHAGIPIYIRDVARIFQGPEEAKQLVAYYTGPARQWDIDAEGEPAVTIAIAKKIGSNGVTVANAVLDKVEALQGHLIPSNVYVSITRNYGETANDKVNELIFKLFMATGFVFLLVLFAFRALRPAIVVVLVIPVVILITVFSALILGYTIDRVSLFALIFSIGILVDDAIVVVENIYRRWLEKGQTDIETAIDAVREVGNPTILATFTVIAALLPMGFVRGMMGPYMEPIPALGSVAMLFSLFAAFIFTPWLAMRMRPAMGYLKRAHVREQKGSERLERFFRRVLDPLIDSRIKRGVFRLGLWGAFLASLAMFYTTHVTVKMLPLDNKPEFSVVINMPEGTALPVTDNLVRQLAQIIRTGIPEVTAVQTYSGAPRPFDFNGMVRHYYLREEPWQGEIQVQLLHKRDRDRSSHEIALQARELLTPIAAARNARIAVVEMPPGPPVLQSVVAEIYGPDGKTRQQVAADMTDFFRQAENLTDVDNYMQRPHSYWHFQVDTQKAVRRGVSVDAINRNLAMVMGDYSLGAIKEENVLEPTHIVIQVPLALRSEVSRLLDLPIPTAGGGTVPLGELGRFVRILEDPIIYHKDLRPMEYVVAETTGRLGAPIYGMMEVQKLLDEYRTPDGVEMKGSYIGPPPDDDRSGFEWGGEWTVTYETFRDMGLAFGAALILIYILVVWEFGNFRIPALIMAPIPLTLLGILPAHALLNAEFTATSMIGWIALAGIIVRNSILLVDFSIHEVRRGTSVREAVILSCKTRTRPIIITALALVAGSSVILTDPIFQGMAISLAAGVLVSTILTLIVIPLGCVQAGHSLMEVAGRHDGAAESALGSPSTLVEEPTLAAHGTPAPEVSRASLGSRLMGFWSKLVGAIAMVFYLLRAVFIVLWEALKGLARAVSRPFTRRTPGGSGAGNPSGSSPPPAPNRGGPSAVEVRSNPSAGASEPARSSSAPEAQQQAETTTQPLSIPSSEPQEQGQPTAETVPEQLPSAPTKPVAKRQRRGTSSASRSGQSDTPQKTSKTSDTVSASKRRRGIRVKGSLSEIQDRGSTPSDN